MLDKVPNSETVETARRAIPVIDYALPEKSHRPGVLGIIGAVIASALAFLISFAACCNLALLIASDPSTPVFFLMIAISLSIAIFMALLAFRAVLRRPTEIDDADRRT